MESDSDTLELESPTNLSAIRSEWLAERIGWCVGILILVMVALGLAGPGLLSDQEVSNANLRVEYARLPHYDSPAEIRIRWRSKEPLKNITIAISRSFADATSELEFVPAVESTTSAPANIKYTFRQSSPADHGTILVRHRHAERGRLYYRVALLDGSAVEITQFVIP